MVLFLRQTSNVDPPTMMANRSADIAFRDYECDLQGFADPLYGVDQASVESSRDFRDAMSDLPIVNANYEKTNFTLTKLPISLVHLVAEYAGRIVFHVSASNWDLVLDRIREKIRHEDENTDLLPIQLLAHSALNRQRLVQVLNGIFLMRHWRERGSDTCCQSCLRYLLIWGKKHKKRLLLLFEQRYGIGSTISLLNSMTP